MSCSLGSWILEVGARLLQLDCTSSPLESVPYPFFRKLMRQASALGTCDDQLCGIFIPSNPGSNHLRASSSQLLLSNNNDMLRLILMGFEHPEQNLARGNWLANCGLQPSPDVNTFKHPVLRLGPHSSVRDLLTEQLSFSCGSAPENMAIQSTRYP
ncbi:hypothetical protein STEG23_025407 [Scotinomys teguina]